MYCDYLQLMLSLLFLASDPIADASSILRCYRQPLKSRELLADYHIDIIVQLYAWIVRS